MSNRTLWLWVILVIGSGIAGYMLYRAGSDSLEPSPTVRSPVETGVHKADKSQSLLWRAGRVPRNAPNRAALAAPLVLAELAPDLEARGLRAGDPVFIRIFKKERELELWIFHREERRFHLFRTYPVAAMSGRLGPKLAEGDRQAPEGFYFVNRQRMNPHSNYHLSFNLGYPNAYDQAYGRSGGFLMVHGGRASVGCFAMTDHGIEEIYTLADAALARGQPFFRVHVFPFRMTDDAMAKVEDDKWFAFWDNLREGYDYFERRRVPPDVQSIAKRYVFAEAAPFGIN
jgi:murein L,D-transpeptidase YafK